MDDDLHTFGDDRLRCSVAAKGAELQTLNDAAFGPLLWAGLPAWPRRSPVLFPIVGRLPDDTLRHDGRAYRLTQHGFARDRRFAWVERRGDGCRLALSDDDATREVFPWPFRLELDYAVADGGLRVEYRLHNPGAETLPASVGAHPAFRWPLSPDVPADAHRLVFDEDEPAPIRRLAGGLIDPAGKPSPVQRRELPLDRSLFAADAIIFDTLASTRLRYEAPGAFALEIAWEGFCELGVWTKPDEGEFLCIEPWRGYADPAGFSGDFTAKPGLMHVAAGETATLAWSVGAR